MFNREKKMGTEFQNVGWNVVEHGTVLFRTHTRPFRNTGLRVCVCVLKRIKKMWM